MSAAMKGFPIITVDRHKFMENGYLILHHVAGTKSEPAPDRVYDIPPNFSIEKFIWSWIDRTLDHQQILVERSVVK